MREDELIESLAIIHGSRPYLADAEIIPQGSGYELVSMDSFSEKEDFLAGFSPEQVGHQMAYAACADILACGAKPKFLLQTWNVDDHHPLAFYEGVARGVQEVLEHYGASCIGGDMGTASEWSWTATVIGHTERPVMRRTSARVPFDLYATGLFGEANAAVFCGKPLPLVQLRAPVPPEALFATDSSGGFIDALENFRRANHGMELEVDVKSLLSPNVAMALSNMLVAHDDGEGTVVTPAKMLSPGAEPGWTLVGGVGEYELLFAVPRGTTVANALKIGEGQFNASCNNEFRIRLADGRCGELRNPPPDYRAIPQKEWVEATAAYWSSLTPNGCAHRAHV